MHRNDKLPRPAPLINRIARVLLPLITTTITLQPLAYAAPSPSLLSQQPRFTDTAVDANVIFLMDDSRSMEDVRLPVPSDLTPDLSAPAPAAVAVRGYATGFASGAWAVTGPLTVPRDDEWIYRSSTLNPLYYNPAIAYRPWKDNGRAETSSNFPRAKVGTDSEVTDSNTQFRFGVTEQDRRYKGPNYYFGNGNDFALLNPATGANPPPVPKYMCDNALFDPSTASLCINAQRPLQGGFKGENDGSRNADLFTSPQVLANGGQQQCTNPTNPTSSGLPTTARNSTAQQITTRATSTRPSSAIPTTTRSNQGNTSQTRPSYVRATPNRPTTTPTTAAATVTTRATTTRTVTTRTTQARPSQALTSTTNRTITARPSSALAATTNRTITARSSTTLQSPINRTVTQRTTQYRYETGVCGSGSWSAWQSTPPGTQYCSNPASEGVSVATVQTQLSPCASNSAVDPNNANQCLSNCPTGTTASGTQCVYSCAPGTDQIGSQCYSACPSGTSINTDTTQCISNCPSGTTATATQCLGTCLSGTNQIGAQCYSGCPSGTSLQNGSATTDTQCASNCPSGTTPTATQCLGGSCPSGTTQISGQCYSACPSGSAIATNTTQCISNCPSGSGVDPNNANQCLSNCPGGYAAASATQCIQNCPGGTQVNPNNANQCLSCSAGTLIAATAQCTNVCPTGSNLIGGVCYGACPTGFAINGSATTSTQCIQNCATGETASGGSCLQACGSGFPNLQVPTATTCYANCPSGFTLNSSNFAQCISNCPSGYTVTNNTTCTGTCAGSTNLISGQCYGTCPSGTTVNGVVTTSTQCISDCPSGTTTSGPQCLGACPSGFPTLNGTTCYADCPTSHPTVNPGNLAQCQGACPSGTTPNVNGTLCLGCPSGNTLLGSGQCCPNTSISQGNCPLPQNIPTGFTCAAGKWVPDLSKVAPARYYVWAPATLPNPPTAAAVNASKSNPANYVRVEINRDRKMTYPRAPGRAPSGKDANGNPVRLTGECSADPCTWEEEAENFAQWYTYYRTRLQSAIAVTAESLSGLTGLNNNFDRLRIGYGSINYFPLGADPYSSTDVFNPDVAPPGRLPLTMKVDEDDSKGALVRGVRPFNENASAAPGSDDYRQEVFDWLFSLRTTGSTPNREALDSVGRYLGRHDTRGPWIQPSQQALQDPDRNKRWLSSEAPGDHISCRRNYALMITDGEWTNQPVTSTAAPQQPRVEDRTDRPAVLTALSTAGPTIEAGIQGATSYQPSAMPQFTTNAGSGKTLSDVTMYYWSRDLRPDDPPGTGLFNNVQPIPPSPSSQGNPAFWQHLVPYIVGYGIEATKNTDATDSQIIASGTTPQTIQWPNVRTDELVITDRDVGPVNCGYDTASNPSGCGRIDDTMRAAVAARGDFLSATDVKKLAEGVRNAFERIGEENITTSALTGRSGTLRANERLFVAGFKTVAWTGRVQSFDAVDYFNGLATKTTPPSVDASFPAPASRNILTSKENGTGLKFPSIAAEFSSLATEQQNALNNDFNLVKWLRGDQSVEARFGGAYRNRPLAEIMGTIVSSQPFYSKAPDFGYQQARVPAAAAGQGTAYRTHVERNKQYRPARVYVGSNGGMLHAFNANGTPATNPNYMVEAFAYVPRAVYSQSGSGASLSSFASPSYSHKYLVDGPIVEADVYLNNAWRTVIVGTTGAGPKGVFGLDVTQRTSSGVKDMTKDDILFDVTGTDTGTSFGDIKDLGHIIQPGVIGSAKLGSDPADWYYFVGNGTESQEDRAALLAIRISDGRITSFRAGTDGGAQPNNSTPGNRPNGLGGVTPVYDKDRNITELYAGDRLGNLFKFKIENSGSVTITRLFTAEPSTGVRQPITAAPRVFNHPLGGRMIVFGTGKLYEKNDTLDTSVQAVYGIWDMPPNLNPTYPTGRNQLLQLSLADVTDQQTGERFRTLTGVPSNGFQWWNNTSGNKGWYFDLKTTTAFGERVLASPNENFGFASITTFEPSEENDPCVGGGRSFFYRIDIQGSFSRSPFANTGAVQNLVNNGTQANSLVGSLLDGPTVSRLETLVIPPAATTQTSKSLTADQTKDIAGRNASASTNPCSGSREGGQSLQGQALSSPALNCPVEPLRVWRDVPRGPR